jgi:DNA-binding CsgD family transcriptional regulator
MGKISPATGPINEARPLLTERRLRVLRLRANGLSAQEVADETGCSMPTAITAMCWIEYRLGARNVAHAVAIALARGILKPEDIELPALNPPRKRARKSPPGAK